MPKIMLEDEILYAEKGEKLSDVLLKSGRYLDHPCAGKGICGKCTVLVNGKPQLSCRYAITEDIRVSLPSKQEIVSETGVKIGGNYTENMCFALDIGSTTLALALVSLDEKSIVNTLTRTNPQKMYGADVISRIEYCRSNSVLPLQKVLVDEVNSMLSTFEAADDLPLFVAGNTTMLHIFFGIDPSSIGIAPYTPVFTQSKKEKGEKLGLNGISMVTSLPCISSFAGADIVAGLNFADFPAENKYNLLIDLGTNAEIALFSADSVICTSAAAGPCFEGADISCGMSASKGAVYAYSESGYKTVGNVSPKGICGTGLIDVIAELLYNEIDETGYMECENFEIAEGVLLSQGDVRQFQLAKSAVFSAVETLLSIKGITHTDVEKVFISGGFSSKINIENAVKSGIISEKFKDKCVPINNSALLGTVKYACGENKVKSFLGCSEYIDLSSTADFSDLFIKNMMF